MLSNLLAKVIQLGISKHLPPKVLQQVTQSLLTKEKSSLLNLVKGNFLKSGWKGRPPLNTKVDWVFMSREELQKRIAKALRKPGLREQWRRAATWKNIKGGFKTLGWNYIRQQLWHAKNQSQLFNVLGKVASPSLKTRNAQGSEQAILRKMVTSPNHQVTDTAMLSSSWCYSGTWVAYTSQDNYWEGVLYLTVYREGKFGEKIPTKTYSYHPFPLTTWCLMKQALGRDGTGAGTVYWQVYMRGFKAGKEVAPAPLSNTVLLNRL